MRKTRGNKRRILRAATIVLLIVFILSTALLLLEVWERRQGWFPALNTGDLVIEYEGAEYVKRDDIETFLVLGLDKFEETITDNSYNNDQQADFLMLLVFDDTAKTCSAIHINRDTMANMSALGVAGQKVDTVTKQIALAHTYGNGKEVSCRNTADAVSELLLDTDVDHYISFTMDSVATLNDLVGGVEVTVLDDFTGIDDALVEGETVTLKGEQALTYVRTRYGLEDSTNNTRMERQRQYLNSLFEKMQKRIQNDDEFIVEAGARMADYIVSDRTVNQLQDIADKFAEYEFVEINSFEGESKVGERFMEFYPDEDSIKTTVVDLFYEPKD